MEEHSGAVCELVSAGAGQAGGGRGAQELPRGLAELLNRRLEGTVFGTLRPGCKSFSLKGAVFPPGLHKDWP